MRLKSILLDWSKSEPSLCTTFSPKNRQMKWDKVFIMTKEQFALRNFISSLWRLQLKCRNIKLIHQTKNRVYIASLAEMWNIGLCETSKHKLNKFQLLSIPSIVSSVNWIYKAEIICCAITIFWTATITNLSSGISKHFPLQHEKHVYMTENIAFLKDIFFQTIGCAVHWNGFNVKLCFKYVDCVKKVVILLGIFEKARMLRSNA